MVENLLRSASKDISSLMAREWQRLVRILWIKLWSFLPTPPAEVILYFFLWVITDLDIDPTEDASISWEDRFDALDFGLFGFLWGALSKSSKS